MLLQTLIYSLFTILIVSTFLYPIMLKCEVVSIEKEEDNNQKDWENLTAEEIQEATQKELRQKGLIITSIENPLIKK